MKPITTLPHCVAATLCGAIIISGTGTVLAASGYVLDSAGKVLTSGFGECVQTSAWTPDLGTPECDPALAARLEAERLAAEEARLAAEEARRAAELAALQPPAAAPALIRLSDRRNVVFEFNSAVLTPAAAGEMDRVLDKIREFDTIDGIEIVGHTDSTGPERYNQSLSEQRAASVRDFLASHGIRAALVSARGAGEAAPIADNKTREGRARNRRVDILISGSTQE